MPSGAVLLAVILARETSHVSSDGRAPPAVVSAGAAGTDAVGSDELAGDPVDCAWSCQTATASSAAPAAAAPTIRPRRGDRAGVGAGVDGSLAPPSTAECGGGAGGAATSGTPPDDAGGAMGPVVAEGSRIGAAGAATNRVPPHRSQTEPETRAPQRSQIASMCSLSTLIRRLTADIPSAGWANPRGCRWGRNRVHWSR